MNTIAFVCTRWEPGFDPLCKPEHFALVVAGIIATVTTMTVVAVRAIRNSRGD